MQNNKYILNGLESSLTALLAGLIEHKDFSRAIDLYEGNRLAGESAESVGARAHHLAAQAYHGAQDTANALKTIRLAQASAEKEGDGLELAEVFMTLGAIQRDRGETRESLRAYTDAESIFRRNDSLDGRCRALNMIAGAYFRETDYRHALSTLLEALEMARALGDRAKIAFMMGNIGRIHTFLGDLAEAERHLKTNIELSSDLGDQLEVGRAWLSLGYVQMQKGDYDEAASSFEAAYPLIVAAASRRDEAIYLTYRGELEYRIGRLVESRSTLERAQAVAERVAPESTLVARTLRHQAEAAVKAGNVRLAHRLIARALPIMERHHDRVECGALWKLRAVVASAEDQVEDAKVAINRALDLLSESGVRFEYAEALVAAGQMALFGERQKMVYLFRAEEYYAAAGLLRRHEEIHQLIAAVGPPGNQPFGNVKRPTGSQADYLTCSPSIEKFKTQLAAIGRSDLPVLLTGETGVGKDQMARYYHSLVRPNGPFVAINCASVPETLLESELFGHARGAFTGADGAKLGLFAAANGGVLFLDEIGDMPLALQAKLLGVIERRRMIPLGSLQEVVLDVKLVAATNQDLQAQVECGAFRRDLFYRLSGISFHLPTLRERKEDIPLLATYFLRRRGLLEDGVEIPSDFARSLMAYDWPGNIRELDNRIHRLEVMAQFVHSGDLVGAFASMFADQKEAATANLFEQVEEFERKLLVEALRAAGGNKSAAARLLGVHEATVRTKLKRYGLEAMGGAPALEAS
ncbi:MAG: sigma 54-interacting transcriptional regulator [candidate division Zixibacteria bacterium]|nr:sigma 54-interacting transcriptional regulator [candidate division Zixibacteria bacterium]